MTNFLEKYESAYKENAQTGTSNRTILPYQKSSIINCVGHINFDQLSEIADPMVNDTNLTDSFDDPCDKEAMSNQFVEALEIAFDNINRSRGLRKIYKKTIPLLADHSLVFDVYANINGACSIRVVPIIGYSKGVQKRQSGTIRPGQE